MIGSYGLPLVTLTEDLADSMETQQVGGFPDRKALCYFFNPMVEIRNFIRLGPDLESSVLTEHMDSGGRQAPAGRRFAACSQHSDSTYLESQACST